LQEVRASPIPFYRGLTPLKIVIIGILAQSIALCSDGVWKGNNERVSVGFGNIWQYSATFNKNKNP